MKIQIDSQDGYMELLHQYDDERRTWAYVRVANGTETSTTRMSKQQMIDAANALRAMADSTEQGEIQ